MPNKPSVGLAGTATAGSDAHVIAHVVAGRDCLVKAPTVVRAT